MDDFFEYFKGCEELTKEKLERAKEDALKKIDKNMDRFSKLFPSASSVDGVYSQVENLSGWTTNFWTGQLWLAYELTGDEKYKECAMGHMDSFENRAVNKIGMGDHDIGFTFTLSTVAGYKITGDKRLRDISINAAEQLLGRFRKKGGFIQLIGDETGPKEQYRLIIDCLMNIHLLFWAAEETGRQEFYDAAKKHFYTTINNAIRENGSAYQNVYFDPLTGEIIGKGTKQGISDEACWSRGQAWVVCGLPLSYTHLKNDKIIDVHETAVRYFFSNAPKDFVPYWDFVFSEKDNQPRDSSAAAIAVCGLLEAADSIPKNDKRSPLYKSAADCVMNSLINNYTSRDFPLVEGLLMHGSYHVKGNNGIDECMIWGDYFYLEAIMRYLHHDWKRYW